MRLRIIVGWAVALVVVLPAPAVDAAPVALVWNGTPRAELVAAPDARIAAQRLRQLLLRGTGADLPVVAPAAKRPPATAEILLCTIASRRTISSRLPPRLRDVRPAKDGFAISVDAAAGGRVAVLGGDAAGLRYGIGELFNYHLRLDGPTAVLDAPLRLIDRPAFSRRILWNWDHLTNWDDDLRKVHQTRYIDPGATQIPFMASPDAFTTEFERVVDFEADHGLNGLIVWGFIEDVHGGVPAAQQLSRHAKEQSVRLLPGVGTVIYGGFYFGGESPYSIRSWLAAHPEVMRMVGADGKPMADAPCPSDPRLVPWLQSSAEWFFRTFKDIGGVNLEHGDLFACQCAMCKAARARPGMDPNYLWDMATTEVPVVKAAHAINPDLWLTFSPYGGYDRKMMASPPHFLQIYPPYSIIQWTYTGMVAQPDGWPADLHPPAGARHSIGLLHQGSFYTSPLQWWGSPGQKYAQVAEIIQQACSRAMKDHSEGIEIEGEVGPASPQNELNYLALQEFTWHPEHTVEGWIAARLPAIYGGKERARRFYDLVSDTTVAPARIEAQRAEAESTAGKLRDPRQAARWRQLATELTRRLVLAQHGKTEPWGPADPDKRPDLVISW